MEKLRIEVVSDVICPFCLIGKKRLDDALADRPDVDATVTFTPFLLDPSTPTEGADLRARLRAKYGSDPEAMFARVEAMAKESGIPLDFAKVSRTPNTLSAQVLIVAAASRGTQAALVQHLFEAYFLEGLDVGDPDVLARIAVNHGFERDEVVAILADDEARAAVRASAGLQGRRGISGVPFFVFDGKYAVSGAQPIETLNAVIDRVIGERTDVA